MNGGIYGACAGLLVKFPADENGNVQGSTTSCVMIGKHLALTAAHCIYNYGTKQFISEAFVVPGLNEANSDPSPVGLANVVEVRYKKDYEWYCDPNEDWALLILDRNIGEDSGYIGIAYSDDEIDFALSLVTVAGYPDDKPANTLWACNGVVKKTTDRYIYHSADTVGCQSGSPIITNWKDDWYTIGVHAHGAGTRADGSTSEWNGGPNITPWTFELIMGYKLNE